MERQSFAICRFWNQSPDWFLSLDADTQVRVYVDYMMCNESKKDADRKNQQAKMDKINKWRSQ